MNQKKKKSLKQSNEMNSKHPSIRILGQRSLPSTFLFRSSNRSNDCKEDEQITVPGKHSRLSLSDFLNRRLQKSSVLPKSVQGKEVPFSSPVSHGDVSGSIEGEYGDKKTEQTAVNCVLDVAFEQLKHDRKDKEDCSVAFADDEFGSSSTHEMQESRKRRYPFEGDGKQAARKILVVLGDDPKPMQKGKRMSFLSNEKSKPIFNHYANGGGWWDCNMEGVDNDEVGCDEVWEGIGSTTLGGLEWH